MQLFPPLLLSLLILSKISKCHSKNLLILYSNDTVLEIVEKHKDDILSQFSTVSNPEGNITSTRVLEFEIVPNNDSNIEKNLRSSTDKVQIFAIDLTLINPNGVYVITIRGVKSRILDYSSFVFGNDENSMHNFEEEIEDLRQLGADFIVVLTSSASLTPRIAQIRGVDVIIEYYGSTWTEEMRKLLKTEFKSKSKYLATHQPSAKQFRNAVPQAKSYFVAPIVAKSSVAPMERIKRSTSILMHFTGRRDHLSLMHDKISLMASTDFMGCVSGECTFGNMVADAMAFYAKWHLNMEGPWGLYYYDDKILHKNGEVRKGTYDVDYLLRNFDQVKETVTTCYTKGKSIEELLMSTIKEHKRKHMKYVHISGIAVTMTEDRRRRYISVRCQNCYKPIYENIHDNTEYGVIASTKLIPKLACSNKIGSPIKLQNVLGMYADIKKRVLPAAVGSRYWVVSKAVMDGILAGRHRKSLTASYRGDPIQFFLLNIIILLLK